MVVGHRHRNLGGAGSPRAAAQGRVATRVRGRGARHPRRDPRSPLSRPSRGASVDDERRRCRRPSTRSATCRCRRTSSGETARAIANAIRRCTREREARLPRRRPDCTSRRSSSRARRARRRARRRSRCTSATAPSSRSAQNDVAQHGMDENTRGIAGRCRRHQSSAGARAAASSRSGRRRHARWSPRRRPTAGCTPAAGATRLFIVPGHRFRVVDGLITNFHLPQSSLLMLVSAFAGRDHVLAAYRARRSRTLPVL